MRERERERESKKCTESRESCERDVFERVHLDQFYGLFPLTNTAYYADSRDT